ncbi:MAG: chloride channel protein [Planctomycetes bacterium]|nr:chloride channel protein [Planctomycetota bacterium]
MFRPASRPAFLRAVVREFSPILVGAFVGVGGGLGAVGFKRLLDLTHWAAWRQSGDFPSITRGASSLAIVLIPTVGGLLVGLLTWFFAREARGHGVPEVISAVVRKRGFIRPRVVLAKALASAVCIGSGGSCGREGPIAQIGAAWGSTVGQWLPWQRGRIRELVGAGAAAGISATFNAPVAGVIFALEVILRDFSLRNLTPIIVSGVTAVTVSHTLLPDHVIFTIPPYQHNHPVELLFYAGLGIGAGLVGWLFTKALYATEDLSDRIRLPGWLQPGLGGVAVGGLALLAPQVMGVGYATVSAALDPDSAARLSAANLGALTGLALLGLLGAKILATSLTLGFGGSGGIFAPSLFMGATFGGAIGFLVQALFPQAGFSGPGAYALVGMAAVVAATTHAPLSAMIILFEMTGDYSIILPLMLASVLATVTAKLLEPESIYTMKLARRGERIRYGADLAILEKIPVAEILETDVEVLREETSKDAIVRLIQAGRHNDLPVVDREGRVKGIVYFRDVKPVLKNELLDRVLIAADLMREIAGTLRPEDSLEQALALFSGHNADLLPVVRGDDRRHFLGIITRTDLMNRYQQELLLAEGREGPDRGPRPRAGKARDRGARAPR